MAIRSHEKKKIKKKAKQLSETENSLKEVDNKSLGKKKRKGETGNNIALKNDDQASIEEKVVEEPEGRKPKSKLSKEKKREGMGKIRSTKTIDDHLHTSVGVGSKDENALTKEDNKSLGKKKRKREKGHTIALKSDDQASVEEKVVEEPEGRKPKRKLPKEKKRKGVDKSQSTKSIDGHLHTSAGVGSKDATGPMQSESQETTSDHTTIKIEKAKGSSLKGGKKKRKNGLKIDTEILEKSVHADEVYDITSGDGDSSKGMKKWLTEYHQSRPGLKRLQERIDEFITEHEAQQEQARKEKEARLADDGWTTVVHHKGRKKTTDSESGVAVGSVAEAVVLEKMAQKKSLEVTDFYRFQKREAHRSEVMKLRSKFEDNKRRIEQLRAARKFKPY